MRYIWPVLKGVLTKSDLPVQVDDNDETMKIGPAEEYLDEDHEIGELPGRQGMGLIEHDITSSTKLTPGLRLQWC